MMRFAKKTACLAIVTGTRFVQLFPKALKDLPLSTPTLTVEPVADCSRYDSLRSSRYAH